MNDFFKYAIFALSCASAAYAGEVTRYFDCWMENVGRVDQAELERLGVKTFGEAWLCGCFNIEEKEADEFCFHFFHQKYQPHVSDCHTRQCRIP